MARASHAIKHFYRKFRAHQMETYGNSGLHIDGKDQRQFTGGSAAYGMHAYCAYLSAKSQVAFRKDLKASVRKDLKKAAK